MLIGKTGFVTLKRLNRLPIRIQPQESLKNFSAKNSNKLKRVDPKGDARVNPKEKHVKNKKKWAISFNLEFWRKIAFGARSLLPKDAYLISIHIPSHSNAIKNFDQNFYFFYLIKCQILHLTQRLPQRLTQQLI